MPVPDSVNAESAATAHTRGVLVVDDDFIQREWLSRILARAGEKLVFTAEGGEEALDRLHASGAQIGLIICDLQMPGMDGMELLRRIGEAGYSPSVIVSSASDAGIMRSVELMVSAIGLNVLGSLPKPVNPAQLEKLLLRSMQTNRGALRHDGYKVTPSDVARAFEADEFEPYFQPKVDLAARRLCGVEALARWRHPQHGILRPANFLPVIESLGKLPQLTQTIAAAAIGHVAEWRGRGLTLTLNLNLSLSGLDNRRFCEDVQALLANSGLTPRDLTFEIVETAAMTDVGRTLETMTRLRLNGFGLAIDDFGTGYSSFEQLSSIPFTELKIDRSFVNGVAQTPRLAAVVRSCIDLALRLDLRVVAEGVEIEEDWDFLVRSGAHEAQGYLIAKPMPAVQFPTWAAVWAAEGEERQLKQAG